MNTILVFSNLIVLANSNLAANGPVSYTIGAIIAILIMGYLVYSLVNPEKF